MKWVSLLHHVQDEHQWFGGKCEHSPLTDPPTDSNGNTISCDDKDFQALSKVVRDKDGWNYTKFQ